MEFGVGAGAGDVAGVEDFVAGGEGGDFFADGLDGSCGVEAENAGGWEVCFAEEFADFGIDGVDGDGVDADEDFVGCGDGGGCIELDDGIDG